MTQTTNSALISFEDFSFRYESQADFTLKHINLAINAGETVLLTGQSGSGKSTLAKCLNGLIPNQDAGEVSGRLRLGTHEFTSKRHASIVDLSFAVGTVLQDTDGQFTGLTVAEDVAFALENDAMPQSEMVTQVQQWTQKLNLQQLLEHSPHQLSGGQKQRVALAGVLISDPNILLLDEPLASLDPEAGYATLQLLHKLAEANNLTTIIVEHRIEMVLKSSVDRVVVMADGQIVADATPEKMLTTTTLEDNGLKTPLYLEVLQAAGVTASEMNHVADLSQLQLSTAATKKISTWLQKQSPKQAASPAQTLLEISACSYRYPQAKKAALNNVSVSFKAGELVSIVGQNGAGKSTFLASLCGFLSANGKFLWHEADGSVFNLTKASIKERADRIGFVMQNPNQMLSQKIIFDEVALGLRLRNVPEGQIEKRVDEVLAVCHLSEYKNWPVAALSFGQKKRLSIAAILVLKPQLLILDEPTAGQDHRNYLAMLNFIERLNRKENITILMVTHDMQLMERYTDRTLVFANGQLFADMTPQKLVSSPEMLKSAALIAPSSYELAAVAGIDGGQLAQRYFGFEQAQNLSEED